MIRCSTSLGLNPCAAALDDPRVADLGVDRRRRHHQVVEDDRQLVLEGVAFLGQVLAGELAEPAARPRRLNAKPTAGWSRSSWSGRTCRRYLPVTSWPGRRGCRGSQVSIRPAATFSSRMIGVVGRRVARVAGPDAAGVVLDPVRGDRLRAAWARSRVSVLVLLRRIAHRDGRLVAGGVLAGQDDVGAGVQRPSSRSASGR